MSNRAQAVCVCCGSPGLTKQYFWPNYLGSRFPDRTRLPLSNPTRFHPAIDGSIIIEPIIQPRKGTFVTSKIRKFCKACNGGWMAQIERAAQPTVLQLIDGNEFQLDEVAQKNLASWAMLMTIVGEFTDPYSKAVSQREITELINTRLPPKGWHVYISRFLDGAQSLRYSHTGMSFRKKDKDSGELTLLGGTQSSSFGLGGMMLHTVSSVLLSHAEHLDSDRRDKMHKIWPATGEQLAWPVTHAFTGIEMTSVTFSGFPALGYFGD